MNTPVLRVYVVDTNPNDHENITVFTARVTSQVLAFKDGHDYFGLKRLKNRKRDLQYELYLKKPLLDGLNANDQVHFTIKAKVSRLSNFASSVDVYGIIEEARNPDLSTVSTLVTYPTTKPTTASTTTTTESSSSQAPQSEDSKEDGSNVSYLGLLSLVFIFPVFGCVWKRDWVKKTCCSKCFSSSSKDESKEGKGLNNTVISTVSSHTEFTELSSRKPSTASSFWSSNPYEDNLILQTKDVGDRWEFPRHHLKFYGILGKITCMMWC